MTDRVLPTGTITFLLTDVEKSTRIWEENPEGMRMALQKHDALADEIVRQNQGILVKSRGEGDSLFCVFANALEAIQAAYLLQKALQEIKENDIPSLRIRVALHTGEADLRNGDYYGLTVNRCARLRGISQGGQVLLSEATHAFVKNKLPKEFGFQDCGIHKLKDIKETEQVWQLLHPDLAKDFPPLLSLSDTPHNLPQSVTRFIGREKEKAHLKTLLQKTRLLTLTGSGGAGKTRLSVQVATELLENFPDGIFFVELAPLSEATLVLQTVATVLGLREGTTATQTLEKTVIGFLQTRRVFLILDNCEHLLNACATLCDTLLRYCQHLQILVSSREGLGITGEIAYRVPSLGLPSSQQNQAQTQAQISEMRETLWECESIRLFQEKAQSIDPNFALTPENIATVAQICQRLDGIPLALELAAARVRSLSVEQISERLDDRFRLLTGGSRTALPRQQTLRALIDWGYDLLNPEEKSLLRSLSVFAGGWTLETAEKVCPTEQISEWEVLDYLTSLVDKSIVIYEGKRYRLLETIRQYARDRLLESGEGINCRDRHRDVFLQLAQDTTQKLWGLEQEEAFSLLDTEQENLRVALTWCQNSPQKELAFVQALGRYWNTRGFLQEGIERMNSVIENTQNIPDCQQERASVLLSLAWTHGLQQNNAKMCEYAEQSQKIYYESENSEGKGRALMMLALVATNENDWESSERLYTEALNIYRQSQNPWGIACGLTNIATIRLHQGNISEARTLLEEALLMRRANGDLEACGVSLCYLATCAIQEKQWEGAGQNLSEAISLYQKIGALPRIAPALDQAVLVLANLGENSLAAQIDAATTALRTTLSLPRTQEEESTRAPLVLKQSITTIPTQISWEEACKRIQTRFS